MLLELDWLLMIGLALVVKIQFEIENKMFFLLGLDTTATEISVIESIFKFKPMFEEN